MTDRTRPDGSNKDLPSPIEETREVRPKFEVTRPVTADAGVVGGALELQAAVGNATILSAMQAAPGAAGGSKSPAPIITGDLRTKFAATVLAEAYPGEELKIGWIYYNRVVDSGLGEKGLEASSAFLGKGDWFKVWMIALGDATYSGSKSDKKDLKDYPTLGEFVKKHGWFLKFGQPRADATKDLLDRLIKDSAKNLYKGWEGQGSLDDFNRDHGKWRKARQYYFLQKEGKVKLALVELLSKSVIFDERSIEKYFKDHPQDLPRSVKKYEP